MDDDHQKRDRRKTPTELKLVKGYRHNNFPNRATRRQRAKKDLADKNTGKHVSPFKTAHRGLWRHLNQDQDNQQTL